MEYNYNEQNNLPQPNTLVFGILSLVLGPILAIILGAIGKKKGREFVEQGGELAGAAKAGVILSKIGFILGIIGTIVYGIIIIACIASPDFRRAFLSAYGF